MSSHYPRSIPAILLCLYIFLLIALMFTFSPMTFASSFSSRDSSFQQDIERASVSVVRLIATYSPSSGIKLAPGLPSIKTPSSSKTLTSSLTLRSAQSAQSAHPTTGNSVTCTGLGFIVASWANTTIPTPVTATPSLLATATTTTDNTWIMTDATLINRSGKPTASSCSTKPNTSSLTLSSIQLIFSSKFNSTVQTIPIPTTSIFCNIPNSALCTTGPVLVGFSSNQLYPYLDISQSPNISQEAGIALSNSATSLNVPNSANQGNQATFITPYRVSIGNTIAPTFDSITRTQYGMPIVNSQGFLQGMYASLPTGPVGPNPQLITTDTQLETMLSNKNIDPKAHTNPVQDNWNNGINDYALGRSFYTQAHQAFLQVFQQNKTFAEANTYAQLTASSSGSSNGNTTVPPGTQPGGIQLPLLGYVPFWLFLLGITGIIILFILLVFLNALFRRGHKRNLDLATKQGIQPMNQGEAQQARTAPSASFAQQPVPQQILQMPQLPQEMSPALHMMHNGTAGSALPPVTPSPTASFTPPAPPAPIAPIAPVPNIYRADIENQPTLVNFNQSPPIDEPPDNDITIPIGKFAKPGAHQVEMGRELGFEIITNTNVGLKRMHKPNEDSIFAVHGVRDFHGALQQVGLFIVADGMGGHADGKIASTLAIQTVINHVLPRLMYHKEPPEDPAQLLAEGVQKANYAVHQHNMENHGDMGTTVTSTMLIGTNAYIANVGDSRTYLYRYPDGLSKVTRDHSVVASLVDAGIIKEEDIYTHTKRNQIYRSLGEKPYVEIDTFAKSLQSGDKLLLCSDGMWEMVRDPNIRHILEEPVSNSQEMGFRLIQAALDGGGEDNVSVIVVNVLESLNYMMKIGLEPIYVQEGVQLPALG